MKRKYPLSFFVMGLFLNLLKYAFIGLIGIILLIIGFFGLGIFIIIGLFIIAAYLLLSIIFQIKIRSTSLKEDGNPEYNEFMDCAFSVNDDDEDNTNSHQKVIKQIEEKIISHDSDLYN